MLALLAAAPLALAACSGPALLSGVDRLTGGGAGVERVVADVTYGSHGQKLDIYRPKGRNDDRPPVILFVHGGSWRDGSRGGYAFAGRSFARAGYLALVMDYRKLPEFRFPAFHYDVAEAVRWAHDEAAGYGGDPNALFLVGHSAGAHIAVLAALDPRYLQSVALDDEAISGVIGISGPYDFYPFTAQSARDAFAGATPGETQPINFARADAPPMLLLHGGDDQVVRPENSSALAAAISEGGGDADFRIYPGLTHTGAIKALTPIFGSAPIVQDIGRFVDRQRESSKR